LKGGASSDRIMEMKVLERLEGGCNIFCTLDFKFGDLDAEVAGCGLNLAHFQHRLGKTCRPAGTTLRPPFRQPEVRMSMCPILGTLVPSGIHRTCRIVAGLAVLSVLASKIQTWSHMASASRARRIIRHAANIPTAGAALKRFDHHVAVKKGGENA
jgi:hypothetical protein